MNFFLKKLLIVVPTLYIAWTVVFVTLNIIPGDPVNLMLGGRPASDEVRENVRKNLGLDKPVIERYGSFLINATKGDLGKSYLTRQPVTKMIKENMWPTIELSIGGLIFGVFFGYFLMDEVITWRVMISLSIIIFGIYIVKKNNKGLN